MIVLSLLLFLYPSTLAVESQIHFKRIWLKTSEWSHYINKLTEKDIVQTRIECGSECSNFIHGEPCDLFVTENEKCYTGLLSHNKNEHVSGLEGEQAVYVNLAKIQSDLDTVYNKLTYVADDTIWSKHIYSFEEFEVPMNILDCTFHCLNVQKPNGCQLFAFENMICYFGKSSHTSGNLEISLTNATVYMNNEAKDSSISTHGSKEDIASEKWMPHIEKTRVEIENEDHCGVLAQLEQWHFSAYDALEQTCYFGIMETETTLPIESSRYLELNFNLDLLSEFRDEKFYARTSQRYQPFIYQKFSSTKNTQHCSMHCYFDPEGKCDFHFLYGNDCYLGNFNTESAISNVGGTHTIYIFKENVEDANDKLFPGFTNIKIATWSKHIREVVDVLSEKECQAHAVLYYHAEIDFYTLTDGPKCHLGDLAHSTGASEDEGSTEVRIRTTYAVGHMNAVYNYQFSLPANVWTKHVFETQEVYDISECSVMCELHQSNCDFFVHQNNNCYLALYSKLDVNIPISDTLTTYHKQGEIDSFANSDFWSWNDATTRWQQYVYTYHTNNLKSGCQMICIHDTQCEFFTFWDNKCWLGRMDYTGSLVTSSAPHLEIFFKTDRDTIGFISSRYDNKNGDTNNAAMGIMHQVYWRAGIYWRGHDTASGAEARCAKRCLMSHDNTCMYYIYAHDHCQLGRFSSNNGQAYGSFSNFDVFKMKKHISKLIKN